MGHDNPGVDTDTNGDSGKYRVCNVGGVEQRYWYRGDGVPDFRGANPPPPPLADFDCDGIPQSAAADTLVAPSNDLETTREIIESHGRDIAALIVEKLTNSIGAIEDALNTAEQMISSLIDTLSFIESLPFVELPKPEPKAMASMAGKVEKLNTSIDNVKARIQVARDNSAGAAQRVSDAVGEINNDIESARSEVDARSEQVPATQESLASIKGSFPTWVYIGALLITLILGWVIYTQVLIMQFSLAKFKSA